MRDKQKWQRKWLSREAAARPRGVRRPTRGGEVTLGRQGAQRILERKRLPDLSTRTAHRRQGDRYQDRWRPGARMGAKWQQDLGPSTGTAPPRHRARPGHLPRGLRSVTAGATRCSSSRDRVGRGRSCRAEELSTPGEGEDDRQGAPSRNKDETIGSIIAGDVRRSERDGVITGEDVAHEGTVRASVEGMRVDAGTVPISCDPRDGMAWRTLLLTTERRYRA